MCPVQNVTYVSIRSKGRILRPFLVGNFMGHLNPLGFTKQSGGLFWTQRAACGVGARRVKNERNDRF